MKININSQYYLELLSILSAFGGESRVVGGAVRDAISFAAGDCKADVDIATTLLPEEVIQALTASKREVSFIDIGAKFGTIVARFENENFEITTLRRDISCDGRHAVVLFTKSFEEDAARRDFTINAISYDPFKQKAYDYFSGIEDIVHQKVRFIGNPENRIQEDFLRILRFFRFSAKYANQLDEKAFEACKTMNFGIKKLSKERIKIELDKLFVILIRKQCSWVKVLLDKIWDSGILQIIFEISAFEQDILLNLLAFEGVELESIYAVLAFATKCSNIVEKLPFSKKESKKIFSILGLIDSPGSEDIRYLMIKCWIENADYETYILTLASIGSFRKEALDFLISTKDKIRPIFPLTSKDLLDRGITSIQLGKSLKLLKELWYRSDCSLDKSELMYKLV